MLSELVSLSITLAVLIYILYNQTRPRILRTRLTLPVILGVLGIVSLTRFNAVHPLSGAGIGLLVVSLVGDAIGIGALRAYTVLLWREGARLMRRGTWITIALWLVGIGFHAVLDAGSGAGPASYLLYLGLTLGVQRLVLQGRASKMRKPDYPQSPPNYH